MTFQELKDYTDQGFITLYDNQRINEICDGEIYFDYSSSEVTEEDYDGDYAVVLEITDEYHIPTDMRELVKTINKAKKDTEKLENTNGKKFTVFMHEGEIINTELIDELYDIYEFDKYSDLMLVTLSKI